MTEPTPTPWYHRQSGEFTRMGDPLDWIADSPERGRHRKIIVSRDSCYCAADYAFIVKAVNNHDALVEALTSVRAEIDLGGSPKLAAKIDTALAAVGGAGQ